MSFGFIVALNVMKDLKGVTNCNLVACKVSVTCQQGSDNWPQSDRLSHLQRFRSVQRLFLAGQWRQDRAVP